MFLRSLFCAIQSLALLLTLIFVLLSPAMAAEKSLAEAKKERAELQKKLDGLEDQHRIKQDALKTLGGEYDRLEKQIPIKIKEMEKAEEKAFEVDALLEAAQPAIDKRYLDIDEEQDRLTVIYLAHECGGTVPEEEYAARLAECNGFYNDYLEDFAVEGNNRVNLNDEVDASMKPFFDAVDKADDLEKEIEIMRSNRRKIVKGEVRLKIQSQLLVNEGKNLVQQIIALDLILPERPNSPCLPSKYQTIEGMAECWRNYFDGGRGPEEIKRAPWSPYDLDSSVVKPDYN
jgi:predicted  nucleic acid-binding Zn-ribbon protein